ncbi:PHP domain-containing protein [Candidatus Woesearchaeota archaeon]|nr:PHP domain-containing protein [Candidatus Woesearchaeota archaeon]
MSVLNETELSAVDMHFHTVHSMDAISHIRSVLAKCKAENIGVAITDHNNISGVEQAFKLRNREFVIPGVETQDHRGIHTIYYFYTLKDLQAFYHKEVEPRKKENPFFLNIACEDLMPKAKRYNGLVCVPHPYAPGVVGIHKIDVTKEITNTIDFIEGMNGCNMHHMNTRAVHWATALHKPMTAGSDGHTTAELGNSLCIAHGTDIETFFKSLKRNKNLLVGKETNLFANVLHQLKKEELYFKRAEKNHEGMQWLKTHFSTEYNYLKYKIEKEEHKLLHHYHIHHGGKLLKEHHYLLTEKIK